MEDWKARALAAEAELLQAKEDALNWKGQSDAECLMRTTWEGYSFALLQAIWRPVALESGPGWQCRLCNATRGRDMDHPAMSSMPLCPAELAMLYGGLGRSRVV